VVVATTDQQRGREGIALFLVEFGTPGFSRGAREHLMGVRGLATGELIFEDCRVPASRLLAAPGDGFKRAMASLDTGRIGMGAEAVGIAQAAMGEAIGYARQRSAFGQPLAAFQAIQFMIADMSASIEAARLLVRKAAFLKDQGRSVTREAAEAKLFASETAARVTTDALQVHGAYGYSKEFTIERLYRDARVYQIWEGTSQIQRSVISRQRSSTRASRVLGSTVPFGGRRGVGAQARPPSVRAGGPLGFWRRSPCPNHGSVNADRTLTTVWSRAQRSRSPGAHGFLAHRTSKAFVAPPWSGKTTTSVARFVRSL